MNDRPSYIQDWFKGYEGSYQYMDNYRAAKLTDKKALEKFEKSYKSGCCGSKDFVIEGNDGTLWVVGFNYGH